MRLAVTGGTGFVGRFIVEEALAAGDAVCLLSRRTPAAGVFSRPVDHLAYALGDVPDLKAFDAVVHAAFDHLPGRYRGGEGDDPQGFVARNLAGTARLAQAGAGRVVFLSSRAVYGDHPPGTRLTEETACRPDTLYGEVKLRAEESLVALDLPTVALRITGVYGPAGPGRRHKWQDLFDAFAAGRPVAPRVATEVHGADVAAAVRLALTARVSGHAAFNVSDVVLDRRDLLAAWAEVAAVQGPLPQRADAAALCEMDTTRLRALGWRPRGREGLEPALRELPGANAP